MFAHAVEYNDNVVHAVSKKCKKSDDEQGIYFRTSKVCVNGIEAGRNDNVYREHGDNGETIPPTRNRVGDFPKCPCDVEQDGKDNGKKSNQSLSREFVPERGSYGRETEFVELCPVWREGGDNGIVLLRRKRTCPDDDPPLPAFAKRNLAKRHCGNPLAKRRDVRTRAIIGDFYEGTTRKVDRERQSVECDCRDRCGKHETGNPEKYPAVVDYKHRSVGYAAFHEESPDSLAMFRQYRKQEDAGDGDSGQKRREHAESEDERESLHDGVSEPEEYDGRDDHREVAVADRGPCTREADVRGFARALSEPELLFDALKDKNVRVDRHPYRKDEASKARSRQRYRDELDDGDHDKDIDDERKRRHKPRKPVPQEHEEHDGRKTDSAGHDARIERSGPKRRTYRIASDKVYRHGEGAEIEVADEVAGGFGGEVACDGGGASRNRFLDDRRGDDRAVKEYGQRIPHMLAREFLKEVRAFAREINENNGLVDQGCARAACELELCALKVAASESGVGEFGSLGRTASHEFEFKERRFSDSRDCRGDIGHARKLDQKAIFRNPCNRARVFKLYQRFGNAEEIHAAFDDFAERFKRACSIVCNRRRVCAVDELGAARKVKTELGRKSRLTPRVCEDEPSEKRPHDEDAKSHEPVRVHDG